MDRGAAEFRAKLDAVRLGVILEGEGALPVDHIHDHHASWAQHFDDSEAPGVLRNKWLERRHMQHQIRRWAFDHTGEIHAAWMNGSGIMVWENVFAPGWAGRGETDRSCVRRSPSSGGSPRSSRQSAGRRLFRPSSHASTPHSGSRKTFGSGRSSTGPRNPWKARCSWSMRSTPSAAFDLIEGRELSSHREEGKLVLTGRLPPRGIGCLVSASTRVLGDDFTVFLASQAATHARMNLDTTRPRSEARLSDVLPSPKHATVPPGMVVVSPRPIEELTIEMRVRECGFYDANTDDDSGFWDSYRFRVRRFRRSVWLPRFAIDETEVTNAQYHDFLRERDTVHDIPRTSSSTGMTAGRLWAKAIIPWSMSTLTMPGLMPAGLVSGCRPRRNGSLPRKGPSLAATRGATNSYLAGSTMEQKAAQRP